MDDVLPTEILLDIIQRLKIPGSLDYPPRDVYFQPFTLSHVCRRWRTLVFNTPTLWNVIYLTMSPTFAEETLQRSGMALLTVVGYHASHSDSDSGLKNRKEVWSLLTPHISRVHELHIDRVDATDREFLESVNASMSSLKSLRIEHHGRDAMSLCSFLNQDFPMLQDLSIIRCVIPRRIYTLPCLTSLALCNIPTNPPILTLADLFAAIEAAPELRKVILSYMLLPCITDDLHNLAVHENNLIKAPRLELLASDDEHFDSSYIVSSIQRHGHDFALPSFTLRTLESNLSQEQIRNIAKFCSITQFSSLSIEVSHWYIELAVGDDCLSIKLPRVPVSSVPVLTGILQPILEIISPNSIISLSITDVTGFCQTFLALWPNVEQLTLNTWNTVDIVPFFDALSNSQNLLAPKLHDVRIIDDIEDLADEDTSPLVSFLRTRADLGFPVKKLHIDQRRGLEAEVFDRLSRLTQVVRKLE